MHEVAMITDDFFVAKSKDFLYALLTKKIDVRLIINKLYASRYSAPKDFYNFLPVKEQKKRERLIKKALRFRQNWLRLGNEKYNMLLKLIFMAYKILVEDMIFFTDYLTNKGYIKPNKLVKKYCGVYLQRRFYTVFLNSRNPKTYLKEALRLYKKTGTLVHVMPAHLMLQLIEYSKVNGRISKTIKKNLKVFEDVGKVSYSRLLKKRIIYYNDHTDFIVRNNIPVAFYLSLDTEYKPQTLKDKVKQSLRKIRHAQVSKKLMNAVQD
jgi:hypothetical protein